MARDAGPSVENPNVKIPANTGGKHGGISPAGGKLTDFPEAHGSTGNPGTEFPWDGADSTQIGANTALPPLKSL